MPLDATDPTWINSPSPGAPPLYTAEELRRDLSGLLAPGLTAGSARGGVLDPRALVISLSGNNVMVGPGPAAVPSGAGAYLTGVSVAALVDPLQPADVTNPRRDRVVLQVWDPDNPANDAASGGTNRKAVVRVIPGTPDPLAATTGGGFPAEPGLSITLAQIDVPVSGGGAPVVTDLRTFTAAAGAPILFPNAAAMNAHTVIDSLGFRSDTGLLMRRTATGWVVAGPQAAIETGSVLAGSAKPAGTPMRTFSGRLSTTTGAGGLDREQENATDGNGVGGFWFGFGGLPTFSGIYSVQLTGIHNLEQFLFVASILEVSLTRIKFKARRIDGTNWANGYGTIAMNVTVVGW